VPDSVICCGLSRALSVMLIVPESGPAWLGVKVTLIVQLAPTATTDPQLFV
jgi:hypothetical protein